MLSVPALPTPRAQSFLDPLGIPDLDITNHWGITMNALPIMIAIWGVVVTAFVCLMVYRGHLTQHETDQLFLSENTPAFEQEEHEHIVRRVNFIQPFCQGFGGAAALLTIAIVGVYVAQLLPNLRF
jgi:hypothetical protein